MFWAITILFLVLLCLLSIGSYIGSRHFNKKIKLLLLSATAAGLTIAATLTLVQTSRSPESEPPAYEGANQRPPSYGPVPPPAPPPRLKPPRQSDSEKLQAAIDALPIGQVLFNHPNEMEVKNPETVRVRIAQSLLEDLSHDLKAGGTTERNQIPVSASMLVQVYGVPYFDVKALSEQEQLITQKGFSEWSFTVTPLKRGTWPLHLVVSAVIHTPWGSDKFKTYPVKDEVIHVKVTLLGAVGDFLADNWQWLWTTILIPVALWGWGKVRRQKQKDTEPPDVGASKAA